MATRFGYIHLIPSIVVILMGVLVSRILYNEGPCKNDPDIDFGNVSISPCKVFSETYDEARTKFRSAAQDVGAELHTLNVMDDYTTDIAILRGTLPGLVIHTSGIHGVEGYAGSAIQLAWMMMSLSTHHDDRPTVILVHAVNPHGMANYRRSNENNVDLNRNAIHPEEWQTALQRDPNIANYQDLDVFFNPRRAPTLLDRYVGIWVAAVWSLYKHGMVALKRGMVTGQYHDPQGIFYGGQELQTSHKNLWLFLEMQLPTLGNGTVTWIDVHTGLGKSGEDTLLIMDDDKITPEGLSQTFPGSIVPGVGNHAKTGDAVKAGYDLTMGVTEQFYDKLFPADRKALILTQEFGTVHSLYVGPALILENMAYQYLPQDEAKHWSKLTRRAFYQRTTKWRQSILERGLRVLQQGIARSSA